MGFWDPTKDYICLDPLKISNFAPWDPVLVPTPSLLFISLSPLPFTIQTLMGNLCINVICIPMTFLYV